MITVSIKQLVSAIEEADVFNLPDMSEGTTYLYDNLYNKLSRNIGVRLSELNFNAFGLNDVYAMRELYTDVLEHNENKAGGITRALRSLPPATTSTVFV